MTFSKAKQEFEKRSYLRSIYEFEKEIESSFPYMRSFKFGAPKRTYEFMHSLSKRDQLLLAHSLLKRFHADAVLELGEKCSDDEIALRAARDEFYLPSSQAFRRKSIGEKHLYATKGKLRKALTAKFIERFGSRCIGLATVDEETELVFRMRCCGWIINTFFDFGRSNTAITYCHNIVGENEVMIGGVQKALVLGFLISANSNLGISSSTEWSNILNDEVVATCDRVIKCCEEYFDVLPKLLKGLEYEALSEVNTGELGSGQS